LALARLHELTQQGLKASHFLKKSELAGQVVQACRLLGLLQHSAQDWFQPIQKLAFSVQEIESYIQKRNEARICRDYKEADRIRDFLAQHHIALQDAGSQTVWRFSPCARFYTEKKQSF
jgi:cysteinyl-tRNA synthetase